MGVPKVFRDTDSGAPPLRNEAGSLVALLDALLVTGYGAVAALGWEKIYHNVGTHLAVYGRTDVTASSPKLLVQHELAYRALIEMVTDFNVGDETRTTLGSGVWKIDYSSQGSARDHPYLIVGDNLSVFLFWDMVTGSYKTAYYFGDYDTYLPPDGLNCIVMAENDGGYTTFPNSPFGHTQLYKSLASTHLGVPTSTPARFLSLELGWYGVQTALTTLFNTSGRLPTTQQATGGALFTPVYVTGDQLHLRGRLRGMLGPLVSGLADGQYTDVGGRTVEVVTPRYSSTLSKWAVALTGDWDA